MKSISQIIKETKQRPKIKLPNNWGRPDPWVY